MLERAGADVVVVVMIDTVDASSGRVSSPFDEHAASASATAAARYTMANSANGASRNVLKRGNFTAMDSSIAAIPQALTAAGQLRCPDRQSCRFVTFSRLVGVAARN